MLGIICKTVASQYDPIGYLVPFITRVKVMGVQKLLAKHQELDGLNLPDDLFWTLKEWERELPELHHMSLRTEDPIDKVEVAPEMLQTISHL